MPKPYVYPAAGVLLPPQPNENYSNPPVGADQSAIGRFLQAVAQDRAFSANANNLVNWETYTLGNWWESYSAYRDSSPPPKPSGQLWVASQWDGSAWVTFIEVERTDKPLCDWTEDASGWVINGKRYAKHK
jgi:hypothetical protein